jgi:general secretion pathway protein N
MGCPVAERTLLHRFEQAGPLTWLLAACAGWALLLWLAALLGLGGALAPTPVIAAEIALPQARAMSPDRIGPLAQYAEAASRPVFTPDRRPRSFMATGPDGGIASDAQSQSLDFILTGVLISPQVRLAILKPTGGGESVRVREGASPEGASGWRLVEVQPRRAVFEGSGGESSLDLRVFGDDAMVEPGVMAGNNAAAADAANAANAAEAAAKEAADAAPIPISEAARIEAIRRRIEARRAQLRANPTDSRAPTASNAPTRQ